MEVWKEDRLLWTNKHTSSTRDRSRSGWVSEFSTDSFPHVQCSEGHWGSGSSPGRALQSAGQEGLPSWCVNRAAGTKSTGQTGNLLALRTDSWDHRDREGKCLPVFSQQVPAARLYLVLYQIWGIWVSRLFSISFWMQEGKQQQQNPTFSLRGRKTWHSISKQNAFIGAQMEYTTVNVKYHRIRKIRPSWSSRLI